MRKVIRRRIPCFTYATDFEQYKNEEHGVYYEMEELPFPYATNNDELEQNVKTFDLEAYLQKWDAFAVRMGLNETGHAYRRTALDTTALERLGWHPQIPLAEGLRYTLAERILKDGL